VAKTKELKKRYGGGMPRENRHVRFESRLPCERLSFQRETLSALHSLSFSPLGFFVPPSLLNTPRMLSAK